MINESELEIDCEEDINDKTAFNTGVLMAKMHEHSVSWKASRMFKRPHVNDDLLYNYIKNLLNGVNSVLITENIFIVSSIRTHLRGGLIIKLATGGVLCR